MLILKNHKYRLGFGVMTSVVSLFITGMGASQTHAQQSAEPRVLPPVSVDAPRQRARTPRAVRPAITAQRAAPVAPRPPQQPQTPPTTVGTTRAIGTPAPAYAGGQVATGGTLGLLGSTNVMNVPFSTVNYTSKLIEDQQGRTAADTLINDASVRLATGANGYDDTFLVRGFPVDGKDIGLNGLYGLVSTFHVPSQIIERIELLKGPGALINGVAPANTIGGGINIISKRASEVDFNRITPSFTSSGNYGAHLESSRRFGARKEWGVRVNGVLRDGEASIKDGNAQLGLGALSLDYRSERFRWTFDAILQAADDENFRPQVSIRATNPFVPPAPDARSNWYPGTKLMQRDKTFATSAEYDVTNWLTAYAAIGTRREHHEQNLASSSGPAGVDQFGNFNAFNAYYDQYINTATGTAGLRSQFDTGFISHKLNIGVSGYNQETGYGYVTSGTVPSNLYNPAPLPAIAGPRPAMQKSAFINNSSIAVVDTMSILDERVMLTIGGRHQYVSQESFNNPVGYQTSTYASRATTPLGGIVFKPLKNVSIYANYAEGLSQGQTVGVGYVNTGAVLAPYVTKQKEVGVKVDWGTITTTVAYFDIARPSIVGALGQVRRYDGEQTNRGIELNVFGEVRPGLRALASYTYLRPEITESLTAADIGKDAVGTPRERLSLGLDWDTPWLTGVALNGRVIYTSKSYLNAANTVTFPSWTRYDVGARYTTTALTGKPVKFRANIENLFDDNYWLTTGTYASVGSPRTYVLSAAFDF